MSPLPKFCVDGEHRAALVAGRAAELGPISGAQIERCVEIAATHAARTGLPLTFVIAAAPGQDESYAGAAAGLLVASARQNGPATVDKEALARHRSQDVPAAFWQALSLPPTLSLSLCLWACTGAQQRGHQAGRVLALRAPDVQVRDGAHGVWAEGVEQHAALAQRGTDGIDIVDQIGDAQDIIAALKKLIFDGNSLDSAALHSLPQNRRGPLVARDHGQNQRAVIALCELRPVQCDHEIGATSGNKFKPVRSQILDGK